MINPATSTLASTMRGWRGTMSLVREDQPMSQLTLFDMEGCPNCRLVREVLTELDLDVMVKPCPEGQAGHWEELESLSGKKQLPYLVDGNTGTNLGGSEQIVDYLYRTYGSEGAKRPMGSVFSSKLATSLRLGKGIKGRPSKSPEKPLELYSFESSPFSRAARERLSELGIAYVLHNGGKQQRSDMGVPGLRLGKGPYEPLQNTTRAELLARAGKVQFPYLYDPNTGKGLFESKRIVQYLQQTYGV